MLNSPILEGLITVCKILYALCMAVITIYGLYSLFLAITYWRNRKRLTNLPALPTPPEWPTVTVQLPFYNEGLLVDRILRYITNLDYPKDRLQIQVLDDSTDSTSQMAITLVEKYRQAGFNIQYYHRTNRRGYKAGNLANGFKYVTGELVAIFDADFMPGRDWLVKVVPVFQDPKVGFLQTRWGHSNSNYNLLTRLESLILDGHFIIEHGARNAAGMAQNFNGSAAIWRRQAIEDAGGWQDETLAEDLDLAYRAQIKGWKAAYRPEVEAPSELPTSIEGFHIQQYRWAKGGVQCLRKLAVTLIKSQIPWTTRLGGLLHLSMYFSVPCLILALFLILPLGMFAPGYLNYFPWAVIGMLGPTLTFLLAKTPRLPRLRDRLVLLPGILLLGAGISINMLLGVFSGLLTDRGVFEVTPKEDLLSARDGATKVKTPGVQPVVVGEMAMGVYLVLTQYTIMPNLGFNFAPWLLSTALSFFLMAALGIVEYRQRKLLYEARLRVQRGPAVLP